MNSVEFIEEVKNSSLCPPNFEEMYSDFQKYQNAAIDTLNEFHRVCELNGIPYQLAYGSLLGAVRDGGQIPWDYDIDVWVPDEYRLKLVEILKSQLNEKYYFYSPEIDDDCRHFIMRLAPIGYKTEALHVDVFFTAEAPNDVEQRREFTERLYKLIYTRYYKLVNIQEEYFGRYKAMLKVYLLRAIASFYSLNKITKEYYELCSKYKNKSNICISLDSDITKRVFDKDLMWDTEIINLESGSYRITKNYDEILKSLYGNYNDLMPLNKRINEMRNSYKRLKHFDNSIHI